MPDEDPGVSPVVATVLMLGLTIVLAATAFVVVRGFVVQPEKLPYIQFVRDDKTGQLSVVKADTDLDRHDFEVRMSIDGHFGYGEEATTSTARLAGHSFVALAAAPGTTIQAGDQLHFCGDTAQIKVTVEVRSTNPEGMEYAYTFTTIEACGP